MRGKALKRIAEGNRAILVHSHFTTFDLEAAFVARKLGMPVFWHIHSDFGEENYIGRKIKDFIKWRLIASYYIDTIIGVSDLVVEQALKRGAPITKCYAIYNGIDVGRLINVHTELSKESLRHYLGIGKESRVILMFGWSPWLKGVDIAIEALELLSLRINTSIVLIVVAEENRLRAAGLDVNNPMVKVVQPTEEIERFYSIADIFISPSRHEGFPYSIGEAILFGLPVVSSDLQQVKKFYCQAKGFITFKNGDPRDLAKAIEHVLNLSPATLHSYAQYNRALFEEKLSIKRWCKEIIDLYRAAI